MNANLFPYEWGISELTYLEQVIVDEDIEMRKIWRMLSDRKGLLWVDFLLDNGIL